MKGLRFSLGGAALALALALGPANAAIGPGAKILPTDPSFDWLLSGPIGGNGTLSTDASGNITAFSGIIDGMTVSLLGGDPGMPVPSPSKLFGYDNILFASNSAALLDFYGILFSIPGGEGELFGDGSGNYGLLTEVNEHFVVHQPFGETFSISALSSGTPEPDTWAMMLVGLGAVGFMLRGVGHRRDGLRVLA